MPPRFQYQNKGLGKDINFDPINMGGQALKYIVPAARLLGNEKALRGLRKASVLKFDPIKLQHGAIRDLARPNFTPRFRPSAGSSLSEWISGQKYGDATQRQMESNYELQNATSKLQQEQGIRDSQNQETLQNANLQAQARQFNATNAQNEKMYRMNQQEELQLGLTETAMNDLTNKNYLSASERAAAAADILRHGTPGTPIYDRASKYYETVLRDEMFKGAKGGKIQTKRTTKFSK